MHDGSEIKRLLKTIGESGWDEVRLEIDDLELVVSNDPNARETGPASITGGPAAALKHDDAVRHSDSVHGGAASDAGDGPTEWEEPLEDTSARPSKAEPTDASSDIDLTVLSSPSPGLFWRSPKPGAPPFTEVGASVDADTTVCIVEVMKLMNHIKAGAVGTVAEIHCENGQVVELGSPLITIRQP